MGRDHTGSYSREAIALSISQGGVVFSLFVKSRSSLAVIYFTFYGFFSLCLSLQDHFSVLFDSWILSLLLPHFLSLFLFLSITSKSSLRSFFLMDPLDHSSWILAHKLNPRLDFSCCFIRSCILCLFVPCLFYVCP